MQTTSEPAEKHSLEAYQTRAEVIAQQVAERWRASDPEDIKSLTDAVYNALVEEANLELRQILAHLGGQCDLAMARVARGQPAFTMEKLAMLRGNIGRASTLMEVFLDRASASKLLIRIDAEPFDLAEALAEYVRAHGIEGEIAATLEACPVHADRAKLVETIGHLVTRFYFSARMHERVTVTLREVEGRIEGFVGLSPSHLKVEELMEEMRLPLSIEDVGIDVAYARAVLDRHGGTLFVATAGDASAGFGFTLPARVDPEVV